MKAPEVGEWRTLQKNQEMIPNQVSTEAICLEVCNAAYNDIKIDQLDIRWACERWDAWEEAFLDAVYEKYVEMQRKWVLTAMIIEASPATWVRMPDSITRPTSARAATLS